MRNKIRYIRLIGLIFVLIVGSSLTFAQNKSKRKSAKKPLVEVVSIVTDEKGSPLKNVSIILEKAQSFYIQMQRDVFRRRSRMTQPSWWRLFLQDNLFRNDIAACQLIHFIFISQSLYHDRRIAGE